MLKPKGNQMSRSYKKPWVKDRGTQWKKICSRAHRRTARQILKPWRNYLGTVERSCFGCECREWDYYEGMEYLPVCEFDKDPMEPIFPLRIWLVDQYDICDWKWYNPKEAKNFRK